MQRDALEVSRSAERARLAPRHPPSSFG